MKLVTIGGKPIRVSGKFQMVPTWRLEIETTGASQAYSFNIASGSNIDLKVDWGDGTVETITTTGIKSHTYADAGTYYMHIRGSGTGLSIRQDSTSDYANAQKVKSTSAIRGIQGIVNFRDTFRNTAITSIPADLFRYNTLVSTLGFSATFRSCSGLEVAPDGLFKYNTAADSWQGCFQNCTKLQLSQYMFYDAGGETTRFLNQSPNFTSFVSRSSFSGTQGTAPALWDCSYGTGTPTSTSAFAGAGNSTTSLTNYNDIPAGWK